MVLRLWVTTTEKLDTYILSGWSACCRYFDVVNFNRTGYRPYVTTMYAVLLGCLRKSISRIQVLIVSMGLQRSRPKPMIQVLQPVCFTPGGAEMIQKAAHQMTAAAFLWIRQCSVANCTVRAMGCAEPDAHPFCTRASPFCSSTCSSSAHSSLLELASTSRKASTCNRARLTHGLIEKQTS